LFPSRLSRGSVYGSRLAMASALLVLPAALPAVASAAPVSKTLEYRCNFPLMVPQPLTLRINSDIPTSVPAGTSTPPFPVQATAEVSAFAAKGLRGLESTTIEGTAVAQADILLPSGGTFSAKVNTTIPKTAIPSTGGFATNATGQTPALTFDDPGKATFKLGTLVLSLSPRLADGTLPGTNDFETECTLAAGQDPLFATIDVVDTTIDTPPSTPSGLSGVGGTTTASLSWDPSKDDVGVAGYDVFQNGDKIATVSGTTVSVSGLTPNTSYGFTVQAFDTKGQRSAVSPTATVKTTGGGTASYGYSIGGSAQLKTLSKGTVPLTGSIAATLQLSTGDFVGDLALNPTQARLTALGFLPITATVQFVTSGQTTGKISEGGLTSTSRVRIKIPSIKAFGAIPLAGGNSCQTRSLSTIDLSSPAFDVIAGGTLTGTFAISDLNGCGLFNGIVSPLTSGGGNTLSLKLSPKTAA
jgi:Fibronectin type III domain